MKLLRYALVVLLTSVTKIQVLLDVRQWQQVNSKQLFNRYLRTFRRSVTPRPAGANSPIRGTDKDLYPVTGLGPVRASTPFRPGTGSAAGLERLCYFLNTKRWTKSRNIGFIELKLLSEAITALNTDNVGILVRMPRTVGAFAKLRKAAISFVMTVCLCVCPSIWNE